MKIRLPAAVALALGLAVAAPGCSGKAPSKAWESTVSSLPVVGRDSALEIHSVRGIRAIKVHRIAVMPLIEHPNATGEPIEEGAAEALTADIYSRMSLVSGWETVPESDVGQIMQTLPPTTMADMQENAIKLGRQLSADAVVYGTVTRYKERVGADYAAKSPAAVAFAIHLVDVHNGVVLWTARYAREQQALTQNLFNIESFLRSGARWVRASDIAQRGVDEAIGDLSSKLSYTLPITPVPMPPGTGVY